MHFGKIATGKKKGCLAACRNGTLLCKKTGKPFQICLLLSTCFLLVANDTSHQTRAHVLYTASPCKHGSTKDSSVCSAGPGSGTVQHGCTARPLPVPVLHSGGSMPGHRGTARNPLTWHLQPILFIAVLAKHLGDYPFPDVSQPGGNASAAPRQRSDRSGEYAPAHPELRHTSPLNASRLTAGRHIAP